MVGEAGTCHHVTPMAVIEDMTGVRVQNTMETLTEAGTRMTTGRVAATRIMTVIQGTETTGNRDRREGSRDRREDSRDHQEDSRDHQEDSRDHREDSRDRREDTQDTRAIEIKEDHTAQEEVKDH